MWDPRLDGVILATSVSPRDSGRGECRPESFLSGRGCHPTCVEVISHLGSGMLRDTTSWSRTCVPDGVLQP